MNGDGTIDRFGVYGYSWQDAFYSDGQILFDQDGTKLVFDDSAMAEILEYLKRMYDLNRGTVIKPEDFDKGNVGFKPFNLSEYRTYGSYPYRILKYSNFEWEVVPFPHGPNGRSLSKLYTVQIGMSERCKHKKEAFSFLKFLSNDLGFQSRIWQKTNSLPANRNVIPYLQSNPKNENDMRILSFISNYNIMENLYIDPPFKWYDDIDSFITQQIFQIIATDANIKESIPLLKKEIDKRLSELRE
jgi:multiple sugar transport system substrate-binding protein